jgi:hypothetical protein
MIFKTVSNNNTVIQTIRSAKDEVEKESIESIYSETLSDESPLSYCIGKALVFAIKNDLEELEVFCRMEMNGYYKGNTKDEVQAEHRMRKVYGSPYTLSHVTARNIDEFLRMLANNKNFVEIPTYVFSDTILEIEDYITEDKHKVNGYCTNRLNINGMTLTNGDVVDKDVYMNLYFPANIYASLFQSIKQRFLRLLMSYMKK